MSEHEACLRLHDRATRGQGLTAEERARLDAWYAAQDAEESARVDTPPGDGAARVAETLAQVEEAARRVRALTEENERLRRGVAALSQQVAQTFGAKAA